MLIFLYNIANIFVPNQYLTHYWLKFPFYIILKALENLRLSDVFSGYRKRKSGSEGLKMLITRTKSFLLGYEVHQVSFVKTILMEPTQHTLGIGAIPRFSRPSSISLCQPYFLILFLYKATTLAIYSGVKRFFPRCQIIQLKKRSFDYG